MSDQRVIMCECLEDRRLLAAAFRGGIGILGDSDSEEYVFHYQRAGAKNYVEMLGQDRGVNFGAYTTKERPAPRGAGYAYNWAHGGDSSTGMIADGQLAGLAKQAKARQVSIAILYIGGNDMLRAMRAADPAAALARAADNVVRNLQTCIRKLRQANSRIRFVLATVVDNAVIPETRADVAAGALSAAAVPQATTAIAALNARIRSLAAGNRGAVVADVAGVVARLAAKPTYTIGRVTLTTRTGGSDAKHLFLADGLHMGTITHALLANCFVGVMNKAFATNFRPFSSAQVIREAGL